MEFSCNLDLAHDIEEIQKLPLRIMTPLIKLQIIYFGIYATCSVPRVSVIWRGGW